MINREKEREIMMMMIVHTFYFLKTAFLETGESSDTPERKIKPVISTKRVTKLNILCVYFRVLKILLMHYLE